VFDSSEQMYMYAKAGVRAHIVHSVEQSLVVFR
jgi:hypothetical protein